MPKYTDIRIDADDLAFSDVHAVLIHDRDVIVQDLRHALRESGLPTRLVGERDRERRQLVCQRIEALAEADSRIVPGTVTMTRGSGGKFVLTGRTYEFGAITLEIY